MVDTARALWFLKPYTSVIQDTDLPKLDSAKLKILSKYSCISPGTERLVFQGKVPTSHRDYMTVPYMEGDFNFPIKYGYSLVGEIIEGEELYIGKTVHVMHPHQDKVVVDRTDIRLIPDEISQPRATLISNLETCVNAIWDSNISLGDRVLIVGFGAIGSLLALTLKQMSYYEIHVVDPDPTKIVYAKQLGFETFDIKDIALQNYDLSYHCSATEAGLQLAIDAVGKSGKIIELSWYGSKRVNIHFNTGFHVLRKKIISSQVSSLPSNQMSRWNYQRRTDLVKKILSNPIFDKLITNQINFEDTPQHFQSLSEGGNKDLSLIIQY